MVHLSSCGKWHVWLHSRDSNLAYLICHKNFSIVTRSAGVTASLFPRLAVFTSICDHQVKLPHFNISHEWCSMFGVDEGMYCRKGINSQLWQRIYQLIYADKYYHGVTASACIQPFLRSDVIVHRDIMHKEDTHTILFIISTIRSIKYT